MYIREEADTLLQEGLIPGEVRRRQGICLKTTLG